jgi:hypothetical protein
MVIAFIFDGTGLELRVWCLLGRYSTTGAMSRRFDSDYFGDRVSVFALASLDSSSPK